jgi:hypothetical protein
MLLAGGTFVTGHAVGRRNICHRPCCWSAAHLSQATMLVGGTPVFVTSYGTLLVGVTQKTRSHAVLLVGVLLRCPASWPIVQLLVKLLLELATAGLLLHATQLVGQKKSRYAIGRRFAWVSCQLTDCPISCQASSWAGYCRPLVTRHAIGRSK